MTIISILTLAAQKAGLNSSLLLAVCTVESNLRNIINYSDGDHDSIGICQVQIPAAREVFPYIDKLALLQPYVNAFVAAEILKCKIQKYGYELGIASYNSGSPIYNKKGKLINQRYLNKVLKHVNLSSQTQ